MITGIAGEHRKLKQIVAERSIDIVVSDNRFGMWNKGAYTIYITHQLMIKTPARWKWTEPLLSRAHRFIIDRYDECWVPDHPGDDNLSGDLSHKGKTPNNTQYIGPKTDHKL